MSKLVQAVYARDTRKRVPVPDALDSIRVTETWTPSADYSGRIMRKYRIGVELQHSVLLSEDVLHWSESAALQEAIAMVKKAVIEEVFGEFRPHFRAIDLALWNRDFDAARAALRALEEQMFSPEG